MGEEKVATFLSLPAMLTFAGFVVPGFFGMLAYSLRQPGYATNLKERFLEAIAFGIVNFLLTWPLLRFVALNISSATAFSWWPYVAAICAFLVVPIVLALILDWVLSWLERFDLILRRPKNGWDAFFLTREPAKVLVHLKGGALLGGQFGKDSYAGLHPFSGHLYIEKAWKLTEKGKFESPVSDSLGIVLRPEDYEFVELFAADPATITAAATTTDSERADVK